MALTELGGRSARYLPRDPGSMLDRLFVPFDRLGAESGPEQGAGLGLPLARGLIEAMNGQLTIESQPGTGTASAVILPAASMG